MHPNFSKLLSTLLILQWATCSFQLVVKDYDTRSGDPAMLIEQESRLSNVTINDHILPTTPGAPIQVTLEKSGLGNWVGPLFIEGQQFKVTYDLGSDVTYVPLLSTASNGCTNCNGKLSLYSPGGTGVNTNEQLTVAYGGTTGSVQGTIYEDSITLNSAMPALAKQKFVAAKSVPAQKVDFQIDGGLGMAVSYITQLNKPALPLFFQTFFDANAASYKNRMFTFNPDVLNGNGATLTIGGDFSADAAQGVKTFPVAAEGGHWSVFLNAVSIGTDSTNYVGSDLKETYFADFDSGSSTIRAPTPTLAALFQKIGSGFRLDQGVYVGPCGTFPDLTFTMTSLSFMGKNPQFRVPGTFLQVTSDPQYAKTNECRTYLLSDDTSGNTWTLGVPFLRTVYSQFILGPTNEVTDGYMVGLKSLCPAPSSGSKNNNCVIA